MKREWANGYVADITYSHGYFHELAPSYLRFHLLVAGIACPSDQGPYTYCELGYGQGVSANLHAASNPRGEFWGTDFNPDHALFARSLAQQAGLNAQWLDQSFEALLDTATPQFDFVVLHGVWSWVSPAAQHALVEFMRRKLKPGGLVYMSYNVLPGWNAEKPLRDLLYLHTEQAGAAGAPTPVRIADALRYVAALRRHGSTFFIENTRASQALDDMLRQEPGHLAHEYFNQSWWLSYFADVERALQAAHLNFACSVHLSDVVGEVRERLAGAGFLDSSVGTPLRETTADFVLNRRFRRDVFMRGTLRLAPTQRLQHLAELKFALMRTAAQVEMFLTTPYGSIAMDESKVRPMLQALEAAPQPLSFTQLLDLPELAGEDPEALVLTLSRLVARRDVCPIFPDDAARARDSRAHAMNHAIALRSMHDNSVNQFASPVACSGIEAGPWERTFWLGWQDGLRTAADLARQARLLYRVDPRTAADEGAEPDDFAQRAERFVADTVPVWRRLGVLSDARPAKTRK